MTKKVTKNVKVVELIDRVAELYFRDEPTNEDIVKITSALGGYNYEVELAYRVRHHYHSHHSYYEDDDKKTEEKIYVLNIYKKITKEVEE